MKKMTMMCGRFLFHRLRRLFVSMTAEMIRKDAVCQRIRKVGSRRPQGFFRSSTVSSDCGRELSTRLLVCTPNFMARLFSRTKTPRRARFQVRRRLLLVRPKPCRSGPPKQMYASCATESSKCITRRGHPLLYAVAAVGFTVFAGMVGIFWFCEHRGGQGVHLGNKSSPRTVPRLLLACRLGVGPQTNKHVRQPNPSL